MAQGIVADNWSLQDISNLLSYGLEVDNYAEIVVENDKHSYQPISGAVVQTEALFDFLTDLILRDEILVDENFTDTWDYENSAILEARDLGVVRAYPFLAEPEKIAGPRDTIVGYLCSTDSLKVAQEENAKEWVENGQAADQTLSATLWGGAGMCARSFIFEKSYTPHPLRKRFFVNSGFMLPAEDALHQLTTFLHDKKINVTKKIYGNDYLYSAYINIPAIPLRVIQESSSVGQMISIALQMRDDFQPLREWLKMFQNTMGSDDTKSLLKYRKTLDSVSQHVDKQIGYGANNNPLSMEAGMGIFKIAKQVNPIESLKNQFGIRAMLNKLIFGGAGKSEIRKYVQLFGENGSDIGYKVEKSFIQSD